MSNRSLFRVFSGRQSKPSGENSGHTSQKFQARGWEKIDPANPTKRNELELKTLQARDVEQQHVDDIDIVE